MSADSFHHRVEDACKKLKKLFNFDDFEEAVSNAGISLRMNPGDFLDWRKELSEMCPRQPGQISIVWLWQNLRRDCSKCGSRHHMQMSFLPPIS